MLMVFESLGLIGATDVDDLLTKCDTLSRKITNLSRTLGNRQLVKGVGVKGERGGVRAER